MADVSGTDIPSVDKWVAIVKQWQDSPDILNDPLRRQQNLNELAEFTENLEDFLLHQKDNPAISSLPSIVIDFLDRLCQVPAVLSDLRCATAVIKCYLVSESIQQNTGSIAVKQLAHILTTIASANSSTNSIETLAFTGHVQSELNLSIVHQYIEVLADQLSAKCLQLSNETNAVSKLAEPDHRSAICRPAHLVSVCFSILCLGLRTGFTQNVNLILEHLFRYHGNRRDVSQLLTWMEHLQRNRYTKGCSDVFHHSTVRIVWLNRRSSLENEILDLIRWVRQSNVVSAVELVSRSEHVVQACAKHRNIYMVVFSVLRQIYVDTAGHPAVSFIIRTLSRGISSGVSSTTPVLNLLQNSSKCFSLARLLHQVPSDITREACAHHLVDIQLGLQQAILDGASVADVQWLLLQFYGWGQIALILCLNVDQQRVGSCVDVLCWFYGISVKTTTETKQIDDVAQNLKELMSKPILSTKDIDSVISNNSGLFLPSPSPSPMCSLAQHLLVMFALQTIGDATILRHVLKRVSASESDSSVQQLSSLTPVIAAFTEASVDWARDFVRQPVNISLVVQQLVDDVRSDSELWQSQKSRLTEFITLLPT